MLCKGKARPSCQVEYELEEEEESATAAHDLLLAAAYPRIYLCSQQHYPHLPHSLSLLHFPQVFLVFQINADQYKSYRFPAFFSIGISK